MDVRDSKTMSKYVGHAMLDPRTQTHGRPSLVVRPNMLTAGSSYVFRLSAIETSSQNEGGPIR